MGISAVFPFFLLWAQCVMALLPPPWKIQHGRVLLNATTIFRLTPAGLAATPQGVTHLLVEVGLHQTSELAPLLKPLRTALLLGFEPLAEKFLGSPHGMALTCRQPRFRFIPAAVGPSSGYANLTLAHFPECSTIAKARVNASVKVYICTGGSGFRVVPVVRLQEVLSLFPPSLPVTLLKVDAQGEDLGVVLSCGTELKRVQRVQLELQELPMNHPYKMYTSPNTTLTNAILRRHGFDRLCCWLNNPPIAEVNCLYARPGFHKGWPKSFVIPKPPWRTLSHKWSFPLCNRKDLM
eukprot:RCo004984